MKLLKMMLLFGLSILTGCKELDLQQLVNEVSEKRVLAEASVPNTPYATEQHTAFKEYFSKINHFALDMKNNATFRSRVNTALVRADISNLCSKFFMPQATWRNLMQVCTKNRFFLCAEEVRAYSSMVQVINESLNTELRNRFNSTPQCNVTSAE